MCIRDSSYTTYLFQKGLDKILKKVGEESTEVIIAGKAQDKAETIYEIADLMYHVMVLMLSLIHIFRWIGWVCTYPAAPQPIRPAC